MDYIIILLLLYESIISSIFKFSYIDEIITVLLISCSLFKVIKEKKIILTKNEMRIILYIIFIYIIGALSIYIYRVQDNMWISFFSGFLSLKALICYISFRILFKNSKFNHNKIMLIVTEIGLYGMEFLALIDRIIPIYPRLAPRFGIYVTSLCFKSPTLLASFAISSLLICYCLINDSSTMKNKKKLYMDILAALFLVAITGRVKAIGFMILFLLIIFKEKIFKTKKQVKLINFIIPLLIVICFASDYIENYFFDNTQSRAVMLRTSIEVAKDYFPLGSGFGTFGTVISREYYSKLYRLYGISNVYGLSKNYSAFITDSMFPAMIGETGFLGAIFYILFFYNMFDNFSKNIKERRKKIFLYLILFYILIECVAETILMTSRGVLLFCFIAWVMNYNLQKESIKNK